MEKTIVSPAALRLIVATDRELGSAQSVEIKYEKSDGTRGSFSAVIIDEATGIIAHDLVVGEIDQVGWWKLWAYVTFLDGRTAAGETASFFVRAEGTGK